MPSKRARRTSWEHSLEFFYQSSTGTDNFQEEKASARQQANGVSNDGYIQTQKEKSNVVTPEVKGEQQKTGVEVLTKKASKVVAVSQSEPRGDALQTNRYDTIMMTGALKTVGVGALSLAEQVNVDGKARVKKKNSSIVAALSKSVAEVHEVAGAEKNARAGNTKEKQNTKILAAAKLSKVESGRNNDKASIVEELRQVERDLEAGDDVCGLNVAKARFQAMLDALVRFMTEDYQTTELKTADTTRIVQATEDPIVNLCDPKHRSTDQTRLFKTRLRDAMAIIDATLCNPPRGQSCSRDCKTIRAQLCNEFTPCNNPTCRAWHEVEAHIEACPSEQCELKNRVRLRETLHLFEHKQHEIADTRAALEHASAALLSSSSRSNKEGANVGNAKAFARIEALEQGLKNLNDQMIILVDMKLQLWIMLSGIGIDTNSDEGGGFPDFAAHYAARSNKR
ncbi:hypothetical protein PC121_g15682 [Phytophthora cactorum]|nr:hypothetical protein PC120_g10728 [Phytophthora cactorum]KAG3055594.1 hypothetical protein PC121_g15682 [Phytophthora cactorum]KAG4050129.1 hypothetical protein PC123_g14602 [Phytophthora cactorum]